MEEVAVEVVMKGMVRVVALELAWAWVEWEKEMMGIEAEKEIKGALHSSDSDLRTTILFV